MHDFPKYFAILNITPDSFSDGGQFLGLNQALEQAEKLINDGADFLDVGGESTRPGAKEVPPQIEWQRIEKLIRELLKKYPGKISLDTRHPETAEQFLQLGGTILNDVSGFQDERMVKLAAQFQPLCIVNHFPGKTVEEVHNQHIDSVEQVRDDLLARRDQLIEAGVKAENIILDPGIGFGKTMDLNWKLLEFAKEVPGEQVLIGHSRKRFLGENRMTKEVNDKAAKIAINAGAAFLRVHEM